MLDYKDRNSGQSRNAREGPWTNAERKVRELMHLGGQAKAARPTKGLKGQAAAGQYHLQPSIQSGAIATMATRLRIWRQSRFLAPPARCGSRPTCPMLHRHQRHTLGHPRRIQPAANDVRRGIRVREHPSSFPYYLASPLALAAGLRAQHRSGGVGGVGIPVGAAGAVAGGGPLPRRPALLARPRVTRTYAGPCEATAAIRADARSAAAADSEAVEPGASNSAQFTSVPEPPAEPRAVPARAVSCAGALTRRASRPANRRLPQSLPRARQRRVTRTRRHSGPCGTGPCNRTGPAAGQGGV